MRKSALNVLIWLDFICSTCNLSRCGCKWCFRWRTRRSRIYNKHMPLISEWCWRRVYKISTQGKYPHMEECRLTNWIWQEIKQIPFLHLPVDAHTHKCAFFYSGNLTFSSSDKPLSTITEKKIMKKEKKKKTKTLCDSLLFTLQQQWTPCVCHSHSANLDHLLQTPWRQRMLPSQ